MIKWINKNSILHVWLVSGSLRAAIFSTPLPPPPSTASETPAPWCSTWPEPSSIYTRWTSSTETSNQRTCWYQNTVIHRALTLTGSLSATPELCGARFWFCSAGVWVSGRHQVPEVGRFRSGDGGGGSAVHRLRHADVRGAGDHRWDRVRDRK